DITEVHPSLAAPAARERRPRRVFAAASAAASPAAPTDAPTDADAAQLAAARVPLADDTVTEVVSASVRGASAAPLPAPAAETVRDAAA
ncbi:hypothetical protein ABTE11_22150, partial [Acinetobacter baumannii]